MKKLLGSIALLRGIRGAKKNTNTTTWSEDINDLIDMIAAAFQGKFKLRKRNLLIILAGLLYVISPIDFLPGLILGPLGLVDDAAVLIFIYKRITRELERYRTEAKYQKAEVIS